jgi:hypothetical protein
MKVVANLDRGIQREKQDPVQAPQPACSGEYDNYLGPPKATVARKHLPAVTDASRVSNHMDIPLLSMVGWRLSHTPLTPWPLTPAYAARL